MIDFTASQAQSSAEQACPFRETIFMDADQGCRVVRHDGHPRLDDRAAMALVGEAPGSPTQQARNDAVDHRSARPTGVGRVHLGRGPDVVQVRLVQNSGDILRGRRRGKGIDGVRAPHGENPPRMQRLTQGSVIERQITRERVEGRDGARPGPSDRLLHLVDQGLHVPGITRMAHGQVQGNDEAGGWLGDNPGLAAKLRGAMAFALANGRNRGIVRVDNFAMGFPVVTEKFLALSTTHHHDRLISGG